jgi:enamine deaminase RidA (YjgF/YER057c/UK114 family)
MTITRINPTGLYEPNRGIYTQVITASGGTQIHIAGLVPWDKNKNLVGKDDMASQVKQILDNMDQALTAAGAGHGDVVRINVYTIDVERYIREGAPVLITYFGAAKPTSTTVEVRRLVHPDWLVEIEATAIID